MDSKFRIKASILDEIKTSPTTYKSIFYFPLYLNSM